MLTGNVAVTVPKRSEDSARGWLAATQSAGQPSPRLVAERNYSARSILRLIAL
jgi:hypothetical protein